MASADQSAAVIVAGVRPTLQTTGPAPRGHAGFSLIELLIALAVAAVLLSLAWPSWREQRARASRSDLQVALYTDAQFLERLRSATDRYDPDPPPALPVSRAPRTGVAGWDIRLESVDAEHYRLRATRRGDGPMAGDRCGDFTLTDTDERGVVDAAPGVGATDCWR